MSSPLNEQIAELISEIRKAEEERDRHLKRMEGLLLLADISEEFRQKNRFEFIKLDDLTRKVDFLRQKLISLELLMLDNSIKSLQSTTGQVDGSVKSLQSTADQTLRSSVGLERSTKILIFATLLLAVIAVLTMSLDLYRANPVLGGLGILGSFVVIILGFRRLFPILRKNP